MDTKRQFARDLRNHPTDAERHLWRCLRGRHVEGFRFRRQVPPGPYVVDFVCPQAKLVVELDGGQHGDQVAYEQARTASLSAQGYRVIRFWNHDVLARTEAVLDEIHRELTKSVTPPQPSPSLRVREGEKPPQRSVLAECSSARELPAAVRHRASSSPSLRVREGEKPPQRSDLAGCSSARELPAAVRHRASSPPSLREREGDIPPQPSPASQGRE
ncbi:MAG: endonuclease domain-containing protein [Proteobacteria bacterium]|nr:endonuclease domain-containing protein [Pseudomonadota bacterium]